MLLGSKRDCCGIGSGCEGAAIGFRSSSWRERVVVVVFVKEVDREMEDVPVSSSSTSSSRVVVESLGLVNILNTGAGGGGGVATDTVGDLTLPCLLGFFQPSRAT